MLKPEYNFSPPYLLLLQYTAFAIKHAHLLRRLKDKWYYTL